MDLALAHYPISSNSVSSWGTSGAAGSSGLGFCDDSRDDAGGTGRKAVPAGQVMHDKGFESFLSGVGFHGLGCSSDVLAAAVRQKHAIGFIHDSSSKVVASARSDGSDGSGRMVGLGVAMRYFRMTVGVLAESDRTGKHGIGQFPGIFGETPAAPGSGGRWVLPWCLVLCAMRRAIF
jgi:hypothetical protein